MATDMIREEIMAEIERINSYDDKRFDRTVLAQHGAFLVDGKAYEVEIISETDAVVRGEDPDVFPELIEKFRFFAEHITRFWDASGKIIAEFERPEVFRVALSDIQPTQFYADLDKIRAVESFIKNPGDIIIPLAAYNGRYVSLDGHTRLSAAVSREYEYVCGFLTAADDYTFDFAGEAESRGILTPRDIELIPHDDYERLWYGYCDAYFASRE